MEVLQSMTAVFDSAKPLPCITKSFLLSRKKKVMLSYYTDTKLGTRFLYCKVILINMDHVFKVSSVLATL